MDNIQRVQGEIQTRSNKSNPFATDQVTTVFHYDYHIRYHLRNSGVDNEMADSVVVGDNSFSWVRQYIDRNAGDLPKIRTAKESRGHDKTTDNGGTQR